MRTENTIITANERAKDLFELIISAIVNRNFPFDII